MTGNIARIFRSTLNRKRKEPTFGFDEKTTCDEQFTANGRSYGRMQDNSVRRLPAPGISFAIKPRLRIDPKRRTTKASKSLLASAVFAAAMGEPSFSKIKA